MESVINVFANIRIQDIIDILIVAYVIHKLLFLIKETRAEQLIKGLIILLVIQKLSEWSKLYVLQFILKNTMTLGLVALLIVFQPELRRALEYIGRSKLFEQSLADVLAEEKRKSFKEITRSVGNLSRDRVGALIVMEKQTGLNEIISTGIRIESVISSELLLNIFIPNTPLHDGALIVRKDKIMAAGCILPLTENNKISKELGTRHRAALGIAEISDAIIIIVSEETGAISVAMDGKLIRFLDTNTLENILIEAFKPSNKQVLIKRRWRFNNEDKRTNNGTK